MMQIHFSLSDKVIIGLQGALDTCIPKDKAPSTPNPAKDTEETPLTTQEKRHTVGLMRVNHAGEVAAQGLYIGQAMTARTQDLAVQMREAANEEVDHLIWCQQRLAELGRVPSRLSLLWYLGALAIGTGAGLVGDKWNLGFLMETEYQVMSHLQSHQQSLPKQDHKSQKIVAKMLEDEAKHAHHAKLAGAANLPTPLKKLMRLSAKVMTSAAYYI